MKEEIRLEAQKYEDHQRRQKNKQYIELEQQISHLTRKRKLTEAEDKS
jgi:hypothetical protein